LASGISSGFVGSHPLLEVGRADGFGRKLVDLAEPLRAAGGEGKFKGVVAGRDE
jgi:hypothetical protein